MGWLTLEQWVLRHDVTFMGRVSSHWVWAVRSQMQTTDINGVYLSLTGGGLCWQTPAHVWINIHWLYILTYWVSSEVIIFPMNDIIMFHATLLTGNSTPDSHISPQILYNNANAHTSGCSVQIQIHSFEQKKQVLGQISIFCKRCADMSWLVYFQQVKLAPFPITKICFCP